jgi:membrane protein DedA with SNARE-associated domain/membrane-associated phospholipid phosphatase
MEMSFVSSITDFVLANPHLAYGAVFLLALSEAIPVVGALVPGSALIIGISALVPAGIVKLLPLLIAATVGAITGDGLSYWLGHRYHREVLCRWPLNRHPDLVAQSEAFLHRHGGKSVFLARFTPGVRAFVPLLAGILRMPVRRFYAANIASALAWAPSHILPGVLLGASFMLTGADAGRLAVLLVAVIAVVWAVIWGVRLALRRGMPRLAVAQERLWAWACARDTWPRRQARPLLDPSQTETRALALSAGVVLGAAWLFFGVLEDVVSRDPLVRADAAIYHLLQELRTPWGDAVMIAITELGDTAVTLPMTIIIFAWLAGRGAWRSALYWAAAVGFASALNTGIKAAMHRMRPGDLLHSGWSEFSFPSGHATVNAVMYGFLAFMIARRVRPAWRVPVVAAALSLAALVALSRLYLGAHWFSDVVGSFAFATAWVVVLGIAYVHHGEAPTRVDARELATLACGALVLVGGFNVWRHHEADVERYAVRYEEPTVVASDWWRSDWQQLPAERVDLAGEIEEPLTIQWAGGLRSLERELSNSGWQPPAPWTLSNALAWLAPDPGPLSLPVLPYLDGGRMPSLTLVHAGPATADSRLVLRLWTADLRLTNGHPQPVWVGSVVRERLYHPLSLVTISLAQTDVNEPRQALASAIASGRLAVRPAQAPHSHWDGQVLLAHDSSVPVQAADD